MLDAFAAATRAGRAVTEGVLKGTVDRMWTAYRDFETSLKSGEDGYQADLAGDAPFYVDVVTNEGRVPAASFARKIAEDVENQGILLEQRERTVLEDSLLTALAQQIHSRVLAAKDLVDQMDADTRSKPMSSGMAVVSAGSAPTSSPTSRPRCPGCSTGTPPAARTGWRSCAACSGR